MITLLEYFEEWRFIIELILAEQLFLWSFAKRKSRFFVKQWVGFMAILALASFYPHIQNYVLDLERDNLTRIFAIGWYVGLVFLTLIHVKIHYKISWSDVLFMGVAGYSVQHIEFVLINEILALGLMPQLRDHLYIYLMICVLTTFVFYTLIARTFAGKLRDCHGNLYEDSAKNILMFVLMLVTLLFTAFLGQHLFVNGSDGYDNINYLGATYDFMSTSMILIVQYSIFRISTLNREKMIVQQILHERQKQYDMSKENIDIINQKCHDMKHQLSALRNFKGAEIGEYIEEVEASIMIYDHVIKTDNEVLNTILSEKSLYCERHGIKLSLMVDGSQLDFMNTQDIYVLLGNALDNAIEAVNKHNDTEKRVISLNISAKGQILSIQTNNYVETIPQFDDGLPVTTKKRKAYHGFGVKSMRHIAEKYGGYMNTSVENHVFMLQIVIPIPAEFSRLLKRAQLEKKQS